jgi:hypothetical protein
MTPADKPTTRLSSAYVRDRGLRQVVVTVHGSLIELRPKGLRTVEVIDIASAWSAALKARVLREQRERQAERKARRKGTR